VRGMLPLPEGPETAEAKQLIVDWVRCEGHGLCAHLVPELIHLDQTGFPVILPIPVPPWLEKDAQQAVQMCPALALRLDRDPRKRGAGQGGPKTPPIPIASPAPRPGLLGGPKSIPAGLLGHLMTPAALVTTGQTAPRGWRPDPGRIRGKPPSTGARPTGQGGVA